jgi:hypothetical protein
VGTFTTFGDAVYDNGYLGFMGMGANGQTGIYVTDGMDPRKVADYDTVAPDSGGNKFVYLLAPASGDGCVAFLGRDSGSSSSSLYANIGGSLSRVAGPGDVIDGQTVSSVGLKSRRVISGSKLVFSVGFDNGNSGLYVAILQTASPRSVIDSTFPIGADIEDNLGFSVTADTSGIAAVIVDPTDPGNGLLKLEDSLGNPVGVSKTEQLDAVVDISFDYRFITDGKLKLTIGGVEAATILPPADGPGSTASTEMANYSDSFELAALGLVGTEHEIAWTLVNDVDPIMYLDNFQVVVTPEPTVMSLLGVMTVFLAGRRRKKLHC